MENIRKPISLRTLFISGIIGVIIFAIPSFATIYCFNLADPKLVLLLIVIIIIELPIVAIIMWLFGKAPSWNNPIIQIQLNMIMPSRLSGLALGLFLGLRIVGLLGGIVGAMIGYIIICRILGFYICKIIVQKILELPS